MQSCFSRAQTASCAGKSLGCPIKSVGIPQLPVYPSVRGHALSTFGADYSEVISSPSRKRVRKSNDCCCPFIVKGSIAMPEPSQNLGSGDEPPNYTYNSQLTDSDRTDSKLVDETLNASNNMTSEKKLHAESYYLFDIGKNFLGIHFYDS
ncbi:unnamed protein product [Protopolystoma xenopodis]|uniref:Uncharacterized protein n=1 Tax=Protopolystoma xenopodis TaxID=117903 RepID=A0A448WDU2_9PLAT|nr:unnamed protein product [Protopolystoma xenopodis]